ncbi:MAG TPA: S9 family peptidase [Acidimicrobiales bacterium]|nr:S9 family peptidase [Acidimicrobiales bacterium]
MTTLVPRDVLFGNPERVQASISPDGKRLSYIAPVKGVLNVWVGTVGADDFAPVTDDRDRGIRAYAWANDNRHLLYIQDKGGDENWRVYSVDLDSGNVRDHTPFDGVQAQLVKGSKRRPDEVLVALNKDNEQLHDVYRLNLTSGALDKIEENPGFIAWEADQDLNVRIGAAMQPDGSLVFVHRPSGDEWTPLLQVSADDALSAGTVGFNADGSQLYVKLSSDANAARLLSVDLATGDRTVIAEDPKYDVGSVELNPDTREVEMVTYEKDRDEHVVLDSAIEADITALKALHPGDLAITSRDHADRRWLVAFTADDGPNAYFVWDRDAQQATFLFTHQPELEKYELAKVEPFEFTSRDGLTVHGYLTFPKGVERSNLPTVLNVHGGPWARDSWGFNPESQWFANRGYLSVQVNFRGSTGYGKDFLNAGDREWGAKMHDDLLDAVAWVVDKGYADPAKVAIYGGSYGGYAALVGASFTPDVFCCAVDIVGPSNLKTLIESVPPYWAPMIAVFHNRVGNPETDEEFLWSRSPLSRVDDIKIPMLIAQGANDPRVKQAESEQIVEAMKEKGIEHNYMLFEDEGHGFAKPENRLKFYAAAEQFLARHLGGACEEPSAESVLERG